MHSQQNIKIWDKRDYSYEFDMVHMRLGLWFASCLH